MSKTCPIDLSNLMWKFFHSIELKIVECLIIVCAGAASWVQTTWLVGDSQPKYSCQPVTPAALQGKEGERS